MFPLTEDEKKRLQSLAKQKEVVVALKKLFLNTAIKGTIPSDVQVLAAERIALDIVKDAFYRLEIIQPDIHTGKNPENVI